jgi:hypothetical protein
VLGCIAWLSLHEAAPDDLAADPGTRGAWQHAMRNATTGDEVTMLRFFVDRDAYQGVSQACNVAAVHNTLHALSHQRLSWDFLVAADPDFWGPMWEFLGYHRAAAADFVVGGRPFAVFAHDWRTTPTAKWAGVLGDRASSPVIPAGPPVTLERAEFADVVKQALRHLRRPDLLARNPLLQSRLVTQRGGDRPAASVLVDVVHEAADVLRHHPRDEKLYRVVDRTYLRPAPTQEAAAELLGLPSSTYRRQLAQGLARIVAWLWDQELSRRAY